MADSRGYAVTLTTFHNGSVDIDGTGATISGPRTVLEGVARRLMTPRGFFARWPNYGFDLRSRVGARVGSLGLARLRRDVEQEAMKEEGVLAVSRVEILPDSDSNWRVRISVVLADGPYTTELSVNAVSVSILKVLHG